MKAKKYADGGGVDPKKKSKKTQAAVEKTTEQRIAASRAQGIRRGESRQIADAIVKDVLTQSGHRPNQSLAERKASGDMKGQARSYRTPAKYTRGELQEQFRRESSTAPNLRPTPIYTTGQTLGYAPQREVSSKGLKPIATEPKRPTQGGPSTAARVAMGAERAGAISRAGGAYTMEDAKKRGIKLKYGGKMKKC